MLGYAIGFGTAVGAVLAVVIMGFILIRAANARGDRQESLASGLGKKLEDMTADRNRRVEAEQILHDNQAALLTENADLKTSNKKTEAELASVKASRDDLLRVLSDHPGALPAALHDALERLRAQVPADPAATAGEDRHGGEGGPVHDGDALEAP